MGEIDLEEWSPTSLSLGTVNLHVSKLTSIQFGHISSKGKGASVQQGKVNFAAETITKNTGKYGSICFVIRRPGCGLCREEALALKSLASQKDGPLSGFRIFGIVKEFGVDNKGLASFHSEYFPFPIYKDEDLAFYNVFGMRKLKLKDISGSCNPIASYSEWKRIATRLKKKGIKTNFKGEGFIQGGLLLIGPDARVKYAYKEKTGDEPPSELITAAAIEIRSEHKVRRRLKALGHKEPEEKINTCSLLAEEGTEHNQITETCESNEPFCDGRLIQNDTHNVATTHQKDKRRSSCSAAHKMKRTTSPMHEAYPSTGQKNTKTYQRSKSSLEFGGDIMQVNPRNGARQVKAGATLRYFMAANDLRLETITNNNKARETKRRRRHSASDLKRVAQDCGDKITHARSDDSESHRPMSEDTHELMSPASISKRNGVEAPKSVLHETRQAIPTPENVKGETSMDFLEMLRSAKMDSKKYAGRNQRMACQFPRESATTLGNEYRYGNRYQLVVPPPPAFIEAERSKRSLLEEFDDFIDSVVTVQFGMYVACDE